MQDWQHLGLEGPSADLATIKRAYAKRLRTTRPDDDAEAYQALREAYDRLVLRAKQRVTMQLQPQVITAEVLGQWRPVEKPETHDLPVAEPALLTAATEPEPQTEAPGQSSVPPELPPAVHPPQEPELEPAHELAHEPAPEPAPAPAPATTRFIKRTVHTQPPPSPSPAPPSALSIDDIERELLALNISGHAAIEAWLPELTRQLHLLPLARQAEASMRMANLVLREPRLPSTLLCLLRDHFAWLDDFRTGRQIGVDRAEALHNALDGLDRSCTDPHVLARYAETLSLNRMLSQRQTFRAWLLSLLMRPLLLKQLASAGPTLLQRLGLDAARQRRVAKLLADAETWQIAGTAALISLLVLAWSQRIELAFGSLGVALMIGLPGLYLLNYLCHMLFGLRRIMALPPSAIQRWDASRWRATRPWVGIATAAAGLLALALASRFQQPLLGSIGFLVVAIGLWTALPDSLEQMPVAAGLWFYMIASLHIDSPFAAPVLLLWVLTGVRLNLHRVWRIAWLDGAQHPLRQHLLERALLLTIALPMLVSRLVEVIGWKRVMCALALAATPLYIEVRYGELMRWFATPAMLVGALGLLALCQSTGLRLGRRFLRSRFVSQG